MTNSTPPNSPAPECKSPFDNLTEAQINSYLEDIQRDVDVKQEAFDHVQSLLRTYGSNFRDVLLFIRILKSNNVDADVINKFEKEAMNISWLIYELLAEAIQAMIDAEAISVKEVEERVKDVIEIIEERRRRKPLRSSAASPASGSQRSA